MSMGRKNNGSRPKQTERLVPGMVKLYTERPVEAVGVIQMKGGQKSVKKLWRHEQTHTGTW